MGKVTPISEQFQQSAKDLQESFGEPEWEGKAAMKGLLEVNHGRSKTAICAGAKYERRETPAAYRNEYCERKIVTRFRGDS
jgi:hypothetical protein